MVAPVTGPYNKSKTITVPHPWFGWPVAVHAWSQSSYRQQRPYNLRLPYSMSSTRLLSQNNFGEFYKTVQDVPGVGLTSDADMQRLYNRSYESFMRNVKSAQADVMTLMRERQKSLSMIQNRALQLALFMRAAQKRDLNMMRRVVRHSSLSVNGARVATEVGWRRKTRATGGAVLEASFGWAPLAADLAGAVDVFRQGPPSGRCYGGARLTVNSVTREGAEPMATIVSSEQSGWALRATVRVVDSDLVLLNSLGLVNVASSLWETTPWSFAFDYFVNVQSFLNSFTDRLGLDFENASSTSYRVRNSRITYTAASTPSGGWPHYVGESILINRSSGINRPTLSWRSPWSLSPQRALTSIALLLQRFKS